MKFLIFTSQYPSKENLYANGFVHKRVLEYVRKGHDVKVIVNEKINLKKYRYEGIDVVVGDINSMENFIEDYNPDKILIHFIDRHMMNFIYKLNSSYKFLIWVHGVEALGWYRRLFNIDKKFIKYIISNTIQLKSLKKFINKYNSETNVKFIFVSEWMKNITEKDTRTKISNYEIIPNVIDNNLFVFNKKDAELRKNILLIRPFNSKKYANDIAIKALTELTKKDYFSELIITIIGKGNEFDKLTGGLKKYPNVNLENRFLTHNEIYEYHKTHGIFLCPTRQDAQGVSMCEAMSSGLVPITSNNTAIPEFVEDGVSGFLTKNYKEIVDKIDYLYNNKKIFLEMSDTTSKMIQKKCSNDIVINKEINLMEK